MRRNRKVSWKEGWKKARLRKTDREGGSGKKEEVKKAVKEVELKKEGGKEVKELRKQRGRDIKMEKRWNEEEGRVE